MAVHSQNSAKGDNSIFWIKVGTLTRISVPAVFVNGRSQYKRTSFSCPKASLFKSQGSSYSESFEYSTLAKASLTSRAQTFGTATFSRDDFNLDTDVKIAAPCLP